MNRKANFFPLTDTELKLKRGMEMVLDCIHLKNGTCGICKEKCEDYKQIHQISQEEYNRFPKWEDSHPELWNRVRRR